MDIERATLFGRSAVKVPLMTQVHREARLIGIERTIRLDQLRQLLKQHATDPHYFRQRTAWRREMIDLYEQEL